ncbi:phosphofurin acidic cluster sorting protein 2-like isoform X5 [Eptesicus fuscus]|uniref:phosphofurin acidic cluster sorting protein 2-like isoform X5 n=1 Tax=Eptesicus fuscus TaxID=29078 RepID=UPI002404613A|nr:phosphofurin acidic cluster sorting protein 2-like isoform X5 [Eptesicus fuscus]
MFSCSLPSDWCSCFRRPHIENFSRWCRRWFNRCPRSCWLSSKIWPQSSAQENREEPTDGVLNSMYLQEAQVPHPSSRMQHGRRVSVAAGLTQTPGPLAVKEALRRPVKTDLKLTFSLQYPHSIKREGNKLQIMLQKKLRLENQTILGYQTLAMGTIDMAEVIQRAPEAGQVLSLYSTIREASTHVAEVTISSLSSQSIDLIHSTQEAKSRVHYSEIEYETISELQASHDPRHRQDQDEEDFKVEEPKKQHEERVSSPFMTRQQDANKKVGAWLRQVQMWKKDLDLEEASLENVPEVEKDIDNLYDSLEKFNDSGP